jgi:hypothetical protein
MDLNPLVTRNQGFEFNSGNPYLEPMYSHNLNLAYTYNHAPIIRLTYRRSDGDIYRLPRYEGDTVFTRPENVGQSNRLGISLMFQHTFFEKWRLMAMVNGSHDWTEFT